MDMFSHLHPFALALSDIEVQSILLIFLVAWAVWEDHLRQRWMFFEGFFSRGLWAGPTFNRQFIRDCIVVFPGR